MLKKSVAHLMVTTQLLTNVMPLWASGPGEPRLQLGEEAAAIAVGSASPAPYSEARTRFPERENQEAVQRAIQSYAVFKEPVLRVLAEPSESSPPQDFVWKERHFLKQAGVSEDFLHKILYPSQLIDPEHLGAVISNPPVNEAGHVLWDAHPGTLPLRHLLQGLIEAPFPQESTTARSNLIQFYQDYFQKLKDASPVERTTLLKNQALLFDLDGRAYRIPGELARHIRGIDLYGGKLRRQGQNGVHTVTPLPSTANPQVWFKAPSSEADLDPGMETAIYGLYRLLLQGKWGGGAPPTRLLVLDDVEIKAPAPGTPARKALNEVQGRGGSIEDFKRDYPHYAHQLTPHHEHFILQASQHVNGTPLDQIIEEIQSENPSLAARKAACDQKISSQSFSAMVLASLILRPSDYKGDNLIVTPDRHLVGIDNDGMLGLPFRRAGEHHYFHLKNILYFLPLMENPVDEEVKGHFLSLKPEEIVTSWLALMLEQTASYERLLEQHILTSDDILCHDTKWLPLKFRLSVTSDLMEGLVTLQAALRIPALTHQGLFDLLLPGVSFMMQELLRRAGGNLLRAAENLWPQDPERPLPAIEELFDLERTRVQRRRPDQTFESVTLRTLLHEDMAQLSREQSGEWETLLEGRTKSVSEVIQIFSEALKDHKNREQQKVHENHLERLQNPSLQIFSQDAYVTEVQGIAQNHPVVSKTLLEDAIEEGHDRLALKLLQGEALDTFSSPRNLARFYGTHFRKRHANDLSLQICEAFEPYLKRDRELSYEVALNLILPPREEIQEDRQEEASEVVFHETVFTRNSLQTEKRVLNPAIRDQVFNDDGTFNKHGDHGRRTVCQAQIGPHVLYLKILPELPGIEESVGTLMREVLGYGTPLTRLFQMESGGEALPVLVSEGIEGVLLHNAPEEMLQHLDPERFSALALMTMLTMPEDGKRDNYVLRKCRTIPGAAAATPIDKYEIIPIDNDRSFVPPVAREERQEGGVRNALQVKTVLFCLDDMKKPVAPAVRNTFIHHYPGEKLQNWLLTLIRKGREYESLFPDRTQRDALYTQHMSFIGIPFRPESVARLCHKMMEMQRLLDEKPDLTHLELLTEIEPVLGERYGWILDQPDPLSTRFDRVDGDYFGKAGERRITVSSTADILMGLGIENKQDMRDLISRGWAYSPEIALKELQKALLKETADVLALGEVRTTGELEEKLKSGARKSLSVGEQQRFLELLTHQWRKEPALRSVTHLDLRKLSILQAKHVKRFPELRELLHADLSETGIDTEALIVFEQRAPQLKYLFLENCLALTKIVGEERVFSRDPALHFAHLKSLRAGHNQNLTRVRLQAPELTNLDLSDTPKLTEDFELEAPLLRRLTLKGNGGGVQKYLNSLKDPKRTLWHQAQKGDAGSLAQFRFLADAVKDPWVQCKLGWMYKTGRGVPQDETEAMLWLCKAAEQGHEEAVASLAFVNIQRPLGSNLGIPEIARGYEENYCRFWSGRLMYKPDPDSDDGRIELPFRDLANVLEGTFDLKDCGDTGQYLSIRTGYRKGKIPANAGKVEIWFTPWFVANAVKDTLPQNHYLREVTTPDTWDSTRAPVGIFWTWGGGDELSYADYLTTQDIVNMTQNMLKIGSENLYEKWLRVPVDVRLNTMLGRCPGLWVGGAKIYLSFLDN